MNLKNTHIHFENIVPSVDQGRYPAKGIVGETCVVAADVFRDGHETLKVFLLWRLGSRDPWNEVSMNDLGNDRWKAEFLPEQVGEYEYFIQAFSEYDGRRSSVERSGMIYRLVVDPPKARFGAWYEIFVRSQGNDPRKGGTFRDAEERLSDIKKMGFDVVYLAPIHPIGTTARKGPNNSLLAGPHDPGSPWAVGSEAGGHDALEPSLGSWQDFHQFIERAKKLEMDVALDFVPHCSPDHPWVKEHPEWFYHREDGSIKCHENPPHVYEDVFPLNFDAPNHEALYCALRDVFLFWCQKGIKIFRVDNPHTKPVTFWEWVIREVKDRFPDALFLAEAFTRPKMMKLLSKAGFSQSYTYFIWRTTKAELTDYLTELVSSEMSAYFRPNFFVTTPDILPRYLQEGGRNAFLSRLALAATLSPSYGIVNGTELIENQGLPGTEEYADSEKYQIRVRNWDQEGNIKHVISQLNRVRRENPSLHVLDSVMFLSTNHDQVLAYIKRTKDQRNILVCVVNLDPYQAHEAVVQIPLDKLGFIWEADFEVYELMTGDPIRFSKSISVSIDPHVLPFKIFQVKHS
ncbi:MAG: Alpha-1,4-glucan:maltose-1-phosphate maltosyltransferase 1 [Elusimicrobia bacterium]|nr:Alpha-1,4-glucan:maltose-1-phosphate maltosyltransferase 1 [Elusimicrobiota bacterium]